MIFSKLISQKKKEIKNKNKNTYSYILEAELALLEKLGKKIEDEIDKFANNHGVMTMFDLKSSLAEIDLEEKA